MTTWDTSVLAARAEREADIAESECGAVERAIAERSDDGRRAAERAAERAERASRFAHIHAVVAARPFPAPLLPIEGGWLRLAVASALRSAERAERAAERARAIVEVSRLGEVTP